MRASNTSGSPAYDGDEEFLLIIQETLGAFHLCHLSWGSQHHFFQQFTKKVKLLHTLLGE